jgi:hypothetical protein
VDDCRKWRKRIKIDDFYEDLTAESIEKPRTPLPCRLRGEVTQGLNVHHFFQI